MYNLPNYIPPKEDEMLISWLYRLKDANALPNYNDLFNKKKELKICTVDDKINFIRIYKRIASNIPMDVLYDKLTLYRGMCPAYPAFKNLTVLMSSFYADYGYTFGEFNHFRSYSENIKICPECYKEDQIFHLSHNVPGVNVCTKHKIPLQQYIMSQNDRNKNSIFNLEKYKPIEINDIEKELKYAKYAIDFFNRKYDLNKRDMFVILMNNKGYTNDHNYRLSRDGFNYKKLIDILMKYYPDINDFDKDAKEFEKVTVDEKYFNEKGFEVLSPIRNNFVYLRHSCGAEFITNVWAIENGFGCPKCDSNLELIDKLKPAIEKNGKYKLISFGCSYNKNAIRVRHNKCGYERNISYAEWVCDERPCPKCRDGLKIVPKTINGKHVLVAQCENGMIYGTRFKNYSSDNLEYLGYITKTKRYKYKCKECGTIQYSSTFETSICHRCKIEKRMRKFVNNLKYKFEVLKYPTYDKRTAKLKCIKCGNELEVDVYKNGCRNVKIIVCPKCRYCPAIKCETIMEIISNKYKVGDTFNCEDLLDIEIIAKVFLDKKPKELSAKLRNQKCSNYLEYLGKNKFKLIKKYEENDEKN